MHRFPARTTQERKVRKCFCARSQEEVGVQVQAFDPQRNWECSIKRRRTGKQKQNLRLRVRIKALSLVNVAYLSLVHRERTECRGDRRRDRAHRAAASLGVSASVSSLGTFASFFKLARAFRSAWVSTTAGLCTPGAFCASFSFRAWVCRLASSGCFAGWPSAFEGGDFCFTSGSSSSGSLIRTLPPSTSGSVLLLQRELVSELPSPDHNHHNVNFLHALLRELSSIIRV